MNELPKSVAKRLAKPDGPLLVHPDADLLTAFLEQKTTRSEREQVFAHLSQCSGCREVVAFAAPERIAASAGPVAKWERRWLQWPGMRWAAVAAGSVIVAAVGIALLRARQFCAESLPRHSKQNCDRNRQSPVFFRYEPQSRSACENRTACLPPPSAPR